MADTSGTSASDGVVVGESGSPSNPVFNLPPPPAGSVSDDNPVAGINPPPGGVSGDGSPSDNPNGDSDGDGIPNGDDHIDGCIDIVCKSDGLSSARVVLNDDITICGPSDFARGGSKANAIITKRVNFEKENKLDFFVAGKPGSRLTVQVYDCSKDPSELLHTWVIQRTTGSPNTDSVNF